MLLVAALFAALGAGASALPRTNPAERFTHLPIDPYRYDYAKSCRRTASAGIRGLKRWLEANSLGESWGTLVCRNVAGSSNVSLHAEGRAIDWRLDAARPREKRAADALIRMLLATDSKGNRHALARRMGIQEIIFNCRAWFTGDGLEPYRPCSRRGVTRTIAHKDHIHLGLNWRGAQRRTTFWAPRPS